ncbi:MAG: hypothetical protein ACT4QC_01200 [Planctomycetaceae bacterium]
MRWLYSSSVARIALATLSLVTLSGCPELNHWSGPSQDPFFSVADPRPADPGLEELDLAEFSESQALLDDLVMPDEGEAP